MEHVNNLMAQKEDSTDHILSSAHLAEERAAFRAKVNPYSQLVNTKPDRILINAARHIPEHSAALISALLKEYSEVYCEFGSGSGGHLIEHACRKPGALFFGIELRFKRAFRTIEKAELAGAKNLYILRTDAGLFPQIFPKGSLSGVFMNFPDPWSRNKWAKNRMFRAVVAQQIAESLKKDGFFSFKTDDVASFDEALAAVQEIEELDIQMVSRDLHTNEYAKDLVKSEFERLFISQKLPIYFLNAQRV